MKENVRQDEFIPTTQRIIKEVLAAVGMTAPKFADALGINYQRIFDLMRGRTKKFNPGIVSLICEKFPEVNKTFLFTGEGNVLNTPKEEVVEVVEETPTHETTVVPDGGIADISGLLHKVVDMLDQVNERAARLTEFERELNEREATLNARELDLDQREEELGSGLKKTV